MTKGVLYLVPNLLGAVPPEDVLPARTLADKARAVGIDTVAAVDRVEIECVAPGIDRADIDIDVARSLGVDAGAARDRADGNRGIAV